MIPYGVGSYLVSLLFGSRMLRNMFWRSRDIKVRRFLDSIKSSASAEDALCQSLVSGKFVAWRLTAISRNYDECANKWIHIDGLEQVEENYRRDKRLIVINSHYGLPRIVPQLLSRMGYPLQTIAARPFYDGLDLPEWKSISTQQLRDSQFFAKHIFIALKAIKAGKIFHTMADGVHGKALIELPILGRQRSFLKSYASLALSSGADVVPVFARIELSGHITIKFYPSLDKGRDDMAQEDRISQMVRQYVSLLSDEYMRDPGSVHLKHMNRFLDYPLSETDDNVLDTAA